jgi:DNA-directed RNA polymerase beta subunit
MSDVLTLGKPSADLDTRKSFGKLPSVLEIPNLIQVQLDSFRWFQEEGLKWLFQEISPIKDFTGNRLELHFVGYEFRQPPYTMQQCRDRDIHGATLRKGSVARQGNRRNKGAGDILW